MIYLYVKYKRPKKEIVAELEGFFELLDFSTFTKNKNCRIIFRDIVVNFFILDDLIDGISNDVYSINDGLLSLEKNDIPQQNQYPKIYNSSGELFYKNLKLGEKLYYDFFHNLTVDESDYEEFMNMICRLDIPLRHINYKDFSMISEIFITTGNLHRIIHHQIFSRISISLSTNIIRNKYRHCLDQNYLFDYIEKHCDQTNIEDCLDIAIANLDIYTSMENYVKIKRIADRARIPNNFLEVGLFYVREVFMGKLGITSRSLDEIQEKIVNLAGGNFGNYLFEILLFRIKDGETLSKVKLRNLINVRAIPEKLRLLLFRITIAKELEKETSVYGFIDELYYSRASNFLSDEIFDIFMENIEIRIKDATKENLIRIHNNPSISTDRRQRLKEYSSIRIW